MKRIYITAIPLDSNFAIDSYAAEPVNYTQTLAKHLKELQKDSIRLAKEALDHIKDSLKRQDKLMKDSLEQVKKLEKKNSKEEKKQAGKVVETPEIQQSTEEQQPAQEKQPAKSDSPEPQAVEPQSLKDQGIVPLTTNEGGEA